MEITGRFILPFGFELAAVFFLAVTGALLAIESRYDIVGVFVLALFSAIGGGLVRDVFFLNQGPPLVLKDPRYFYVVAIAGVICLIFGNHLSRLRLVFFLADALGLGIFAVVGAQRALEFGLAMVPAAVVGLGNAVGGGVLRDVLTRKESLLFKPGEFYVLAAIAGVSVFLGMARWGHIPAPRAAVISIAVTLLVRILAVQLNLRTKVATPIFGHRKATSSPTTGRSSHVQ